MGALHCFSLKIYGFVAVMLFTWSLYKVFQLECLILLIIKIIISNQISAWSYLSKFFFNKKACNVVSQSSKKEERTFPHETIFVFIWYFIGTILSKNSHQKQGVRKKDKKEGWSYSRGWGVGCLQKGDQTFFTLCTKMFQNKTL